MRMSRWLALAAMVAALTPMRAPANAATNVRGILEQMSLAQQKLKTLRLHQVMTSTMSPSGSMVVDLSVQKPNKVHMEMRMGKAAKPISIAVCDGKTLWRYDGMANQYIVQPPPKDFENMLSPIPMSGSKMKEYLDRASKGATLVGTESIHGVSAYVVKLAQPGVATKLWIGQKDLQIHRAVLDTTVRTRKMLEERAKQMKQPVPKMKGPVITTVEITNIQIDKPIPASVFTFTPPPGARKATMPPPGAGGMPGAPRAIPGR